MFWVKGLRLAHFQIFKKSPSLLNLEVFPKKKIFWPIFSDALNSPGLRTNGPRDMGLGPKCRLDTPLPLGIKKNFFTLFQNSEIYPFEVEMAKKLLGAEPFDLETWEWFQMKVYILYYPMVV